MNRIRDLRNAQGWTQLQLGKKLGMAKSTISGYESEDRQLTPGTIHSLCDLFGCTADYLLCRSEAPHPQVSPEDTKLLKTYHALPLEIRRAVDGLMAPYAAEAVPGKMGT